jgi:hypothetical protein
MTRFTPNMLLLLVLALLVDPRAAFAAESYDNCTGVIASLPAVIGTQGTWCVKQNLSTAVTSGNAITINISNVTIDCNDFKVDGLGAGATTATNGIYSNNLRNIIVRNCDIRGFYRGVRLAGTGGGHLIEDNRLEDNTYIGLNLLGNGSIVRRNRVFDTGGSTLSATAYGIHATNSIDVLDNTISGVLARTNGNGSAYGVYTASNPNGSISNNRIRGLLKDGTGQARGISNDSNDRISMLNNDLVGISGTGTLGLRCASANGSAKGNVINGFVTGITGCANDGGNVVVP